MRNVLNFFASYVIKIHSRKVKTSSTIHAGSAFNLSHHCQKFCSALSRLSNITHTISLIVLLLRSSRGHLYLTALCDTRWYRTSLGPGFNRTLIHLSQSAMLCAGGPVPHPSHALVGNPGAAPGFSCFQSRRLAQLGHI